LTDTLVRVARLDELPEAVATAVDVEGKSLALIRLGESVFAIRNRCPHMTIDFTDAHVIDRAAGTVDEIVWERDPVIVCLWHQFEFSVSRGECLTNSALRFATYATDIRDGDVYVDPTPRTRGAEGSD
jgi:nitrite reductase/ring-hydroxylating ferredoxin subunit